MRHGLAEKSHIFTIYIFLLYKALVSWYAYCWFRGCVNHHPGKTFLKGTAVDALKNRFLSAEFVSCFFIFIVAPTLFLFETRELSADSRIFPAATSLVMLAVGLKRIFLPGAPGKSQPPPMLLLARAVFPLVIFCALVDVIGFYADCMLLTAIYYLHFDAPITTRKLLRALVAAVLITGVTYVFFYYGLKLVMPEGIVFAD